MVDRELRDLAQREEIIDTLESILDELRRAPQGA